MLVDSVMLNGVPARNSSFESPIVNDYQSSPAGGESSFVGTAGLAENRGTYGNPSTTDGNQAAFVSNHGSVSQTMALVPDTYEVSLNAAQRTGNEGTQRVRVIFRTSASVISSKTFVWCGNQICEERNASGATVNKRFFAEGEQWVNISNPGNYYYTRDHLGSIREVTNSSGGLMARYDYDPYGNRVVLGGKMDFQLGYTGHYYHLPSGLNLTLHRAYSPSIGRWLSRDPLEEVEDLNLYAYVAIDPVDQIDPLGLQGTPGVPVPQPRLIEVEPPPPTPSGVPPPVGPRPGPHLPAQFYGKYCGPYNRSGTPIDCVDGACKKHDDCYGLCGAAGFWSVVKGGKCVRACDNSLCENEKNCRCRDFTKAMAARNTIMKIFCTTRSLP